MSGNDDSMETGGRSDPPSDREPKRHKVIQFPIRHANGATKVYQNDRCYRDNSKFLEKFFNHESNAICFTRPMQLGKSILFSLAEELFSINKNSNVDSGLKYSPGADDKNQWYVLRVNFGAVCPQGESREQKFRALDMSALTQVKQSVMHLLLAEGNEQLHGRFKELSLGRAMIDLTIGELITSLTRSVERVDGRLLILVDEYDRPIREGLLGLMPKHELGLYARLKADIPRRFPNYFGFFSAVKVALDSVDSKIWLTGIVPIGIKEMSGLNVAHLTFLPDMADAVGFTEDHVQTMLDHVHENVPFRDTNELEQTSKLLKKHYNRLQFPGGKPLYHTALTNAIMHRLQKDLEVRRAFVGRGAVPESIRVEPVSEALFEVLCSAKNLRHVANKLAAGDELRGYKLNYTLSLEHLLRDTIDVSDYLTLLVHVGVASVTITRDEAHLKVATFRLTSESYRDNLLEPIVRTLKKSLEKLVSCKTKEELYNCGEDILIDFVTSMSKNRMTALMAWAASNEKNHILELQLQANIIADAHSILFEHAETTQEVTLPATGQRTDVTFSSSTCVVVLELKQVASKDPPGTAFITSAHAQLAGYVETMRQMEAMGHKRPVAGFVVIMHNDGASYIVEKLEGDGDT